jgi:hypothetical protein
MLLARNHLAVASGFKELNRQDKDEQRLVRLCLECVQDFDRPGS